MKLIRQTMRIFWAIVLRDMRSRFGGTYYSYAIAVGWPLTHLIILFGINLFVRRIAPIGNDPAVFIATGIAPYILSFYPCRLMCYAVSHNKVLLQYPIVQPIYLFAARAFLEITTAVLVLIIFVAGLAAFGIWTEPQNYTQAFYAMVLAICFGIVMGFLGVFLHAVLGNFSAIFVTTIIFIAYAASGAFNPFFMLSQNVRDMFWYNPLYHVIGLLRGAYYDSYLLEDFSYSYVMFFCGVVLFIALLGERAVRGALIKP